MKAITQRGMYCFRIDRATGYESGWAVTHQLCLLNAISGDDFRKEFGVSLANNPDDLRRSLWLSTHRVRFWNGKNLDRELLERATQSKPLIERAVRVWDNAGSPDFFHNLRFCPRCLRQGVHLYIYQFTWIRNCPYHGVGLEERCPRCHRDIDYAAPNKRGPFACCCGHRFWEPRTVADWRIDPLMQKTLADAGATFERMREKYSPCELFSSFEEEWGRRNGPAPPRYQYPWCTTHTLANVWATVDPKNGRIPRNFDDSLAPRTTSIFVAIPRCRRRDPTIGTVYYQDPGRATYKAICRHFYRKVLRRHRRSIKAIAICRHHDSGRIPRGLRMQCIFDPAAMTFVLWKCLWEWRHPDELYKDERREVTWKWERQEKETYDHDGCTVWLFDDVDFKRTDREALDEALHVRYVATRCLASFDEIAARIEAIRRTRSVHYLPVNMIDWRYMPTMAVVLHNDVSCILYSFWPAERWISSDVFQTWLQTIPTPSQIKKYLAMVRRRSKAWQAHGKFVWPRNGRDGVYFLDGPSCFRQDRDYWT